MTFKGKSDVDRRAKQTAKYARIISVRRQTWHMEYLSEADAKLIAKNMGVSSRTVYRDWAVLKAAYETTGRRLDPPDGGMAVLSNLFDANNRVSELLQERLVQANDQLRGLLRRVIQAFDDGGLSCGSILLDDIRSALR